MNARRLANGRLLIPVRAESSDGTLGDGMVEIGPDHPDYAAWLAEAPKFIDIAMPDRFVLEVLQSGEGWVEEALYRGGDFTRLEDGSYYTQRGGTGTPLYLRCVGREDEVIRCAFHNGVFEYRLREVDPGSTGSPNQ